jgi:hypothetical protein
VVLMTAEVLQKGKILADLLIFQLHIKTSIFLVNLFKLFPLVGNRMEASSTGNCTLALCHAEILVTGLVKSHRAKSILRTI